MVGLRTGILDLSTGIVDDALGAMEESFLGALNWCASNPEFLMKKRIFSWHIPMRRI